MKSFLSSRAVNARKRKETGESLKVTTRRKRRRETLAAAKDIHGGHKGAIDGLVDTVDKLLKAEDIIDAAEKNKCGTLKSKVIPKLYKKSSKEFETSSNNMLRSIAVYYTNGVMGKKKYRSTYKILSYKFTKRR